MNWGHCSRAEPCTCARPPPSSQVERLQRKFAMIHSTLAQQQAAKGDPDTPKLRQSGDAAPLAASQAAAAAAQAALNVSAANPLVGGSGSNGMWRIVLTVHAYWGGQLELAYLPRLTLVAY